MNNKGFSLIEVLMAAGIGTLVAGGVASIFVFALGQFRLLIDRNEAEEQLLWASYYLRSYLSQAVESDGVNYPIASGSTGNRGRILSQYYSNPKTVAEATTVNGISWSSDFARSASDSALFDTIGVFNREFAIANSGSLPISDMRPAAIFYKRPTQNSPGILYFDNARSGTGGAMTLSPGREDLFLDRIVEFRMETELEDDFVKSSEIKLKSRHFLTSYNIASGGDNVWCPTVSSGQVRSPCDGLRFQDLEITINIDYRNNIIQAVPVTGTSSSTYQERLYGGLYFFRMLLPRGIITQ